MGEDVAGDRSLGDGDRPIFVGAKRSRSHVFGWLHSSIRECFAPTALTRSVSSLLPLVVCLLPTVAAAQIVPDTTLPVNSTVTPDGNTLTIEGGTAAGGNLFHSFEQFSVPAGTTAFFNNNPALQNIFTRVTGGSISTIDGILQTNGTANLFLLNPNGIIFGPNASLNVGGSFVAATGDRLNFADGSFFSARAGETSALLTVSVPVGLQYGSNPGGILVQGSFLEVQPGKTLALMGGDIALEGAGLLAPEGRIEVASVASGSLAISSPQFALGSESETTQFADIQLSLGSAIDTIGDSGGGDIQLLGRRVTLADGALIQSTTLGTQRGGNITIRASESVELRGNTPDGFPSGLLAETEGSGDGGDIAITAGRLIFQNGGQASASALEGSTGKGGNITVTASDSAEFIGETPLIEDGTGSAFTLGSGLFSSTRGTGAGGDVRITVPRLLVSDGAQIGASTFSRGGGGNMFVTASDVELRGISAVLQIPSGLGANAEGTGDGGNVTISARKLTVTEGAQVTTSTLGAGKAGDILVRAEESVYLSGSESGLFAVVVEGATGNGGNLTVETGELLLQGARVSANTVGSGQGGNLTIDAERLIVQNGGQVSAITFSSGAGGTVTVKASQLLELSGSSTEINPATGLPIPSGLFTQTQGAGNAGDARISTGRLLVRDGAKVSVSGEATGNAGNLEITANRLLLEGSGILTGETVSGEGGNIQVRSKDVQLRRQSAISTTAGTANRPGNGGNIAVQTDTMVGWENSDISANAFEGTGGRVDITTQGIFGLEARSRLDLETLLGTSDLSEFSPSQLNTSDITAISRTAPELSGIVAIQTPDIDPARGLLDLAPELVDVSRLIDETLCAVGSQSELVRTGKGGLPATPNDAFSGEAVWEDWRATEVGRREGISSNFNPQVSIRDRIVEARDWQINGNGELVLIASAPVNLITPAGCSPANLPHTLKDIPRSQAEPGNAVVEALPPEVKEDEAEPRKSHSQAEPGNEKNEKNAEKTFRVNGFEVVGSTIFKPEEFAELLAPFAQKSLTFEQLLAARTAVTQLYVNNGYITSGAFIPPQVSQNGTVAIQVLEGKLEDIQVHTRGRLNSNYVKSRLVREINPPLNDKKLLRALQLLQLDPQIEKLSAELSAGVRPGTNLLTVRVEEIPAFSTQLAVDNNRAPSVGSFRQTAQASYANLLGLGDVTSVAYTKTEGSGDWDIGYTLPINSRNGAIAFSYSTASSTIIEAPFDRLDIKAKSRTYDLTYRQPLLQTIRENSIIQEFSLGLTASRRESQTSLLGVNYPLSLGANDEGETRISALRFFQEWRQRSEREVLAARSEFSLGVGLFDATVNSSQPDSQFLAWRGQGQWVRRIGEGADTLGDTLLVVRGGVQLSAGELLALEQFGLGGQNSVRGYRQDVLLTDNGALASVELRVPILRLARQSGLVQVAPFVDAGAAWNSSDRTSPSANFLASAGIGLRLRLGNGLAANLDWGIPLVNLDSKGKTWQENGLYFSITSSPF